MASADVRRWEGDPADFLRTIDAAFGTVPAADELASQSALLPGERTWGAYDGSALVGGLTSYAFDLAVVGGTLPAAGITHVGVLPTHRRRGIFRSLLEAKLQDCAERGEPLAVLWASEAAIYRGFGFGPATFAVHHEARRTRAQGRPAPGDVRLVGADEARSLLPAIHARACARPGSIARWPEWWERMVMPRLREGAAKPLFALVASESGSPEAYALYRMEGSWGDHTPRYTLHVEELYAASAAAERALWETLLAMDLVDTVEADLRPVDDSLLLLVEEARRLRPTISDALYLRLLDLPAALAGRTYAAPGTLRLEVVDERIPANAGGWRLTVGEDGRGALERDAGATDVTLDTGALASAYLGAVSFLQLADAGLASADGDAVARADALFATPRPPWCGQWF